MREKYSNHFVNLDELVYTPLRAVAQSNVQLSGSVMDLIASTGDTNPADANDTIHLKTVNLAYEQINNDSINGKVLEEIGLKIPLISIVPITNLQVKKTKVAFDAEIKKTKKNKKTKNHYNMEARICSPLKQRRKDDGLPKISFEIELENVAVPEGMARFVDILNANPIPETLSSKQINDSGEVITGDDAVYYQKLKDLRLNEYKLNLAGEKLSGLIATKKLKFDTLLKQNEQQSTFDSLFSSNEEDNKKMLEKVSKQCSNPQEMKELYINILDAMKTYQKIMDKAIESSDQRIQMEIEHIKNEFDQSANPQ